MQELLQSPKTWITLIYVAAGFFLLTRAPELRVKRLRLGISLLFLVVFIGLLFATSNLVVLILGVLLLRPAFLVFGLIWSEVVGHYAGAALESVAFGDESSEKAAARTSLRAERYFRETGRIGWAVSSLKRRLRKDPDDFESAFLLASIHAVDEKDLSSARKVVESIVNSPGISERHKELTAAEYERWRIESGMSDTVPALDSRTSTGKARAPRSPCDEAKKLRIEGKPKEAAELLERAHRARPGDYETMLLLAAISAEDLQDLAGAKQWVERIRAEPYLTAGYKEFAERCLTDWVQGAKKKQEGQDAEAPNDSDSAVPSREELPANLLDLAVLNKKEGRLGSAVDALNDLLLAEPAHWEGMLMLASIQAEDIGRYERAKEMVEHILASDAPSEVKQQASEKLAQWRKRKYDGLRPY